MKNENELAELSEVSSEWREEPETERIRKGILQKASVMRAGAVL